MSMVNTSVVEAFHGQYLSTTSWKSLTMTDTMVDHCLIRPVIELAPVGIEKPATQDVRKSASPMKTTWLYLMDDHCNQGSFAD